MESIIQHVAIDVVYIGGPIVRVVGVGQDVPDPDAGLNLVPPEVPALAFRAAVAHTGALPSPTSSISIYAVPTSYPE